MIRSHSVAILSLEQRSTQPDSHALVLGVVRQGCFTQLPPDAAGLVTAERESEMQ